VVARRIKRESKIASLDRKEAAFFCFFWFVFLYLFICLPPPPRTRLLLALRRLVAPLMKLGLDYVRD
jgi:hypothetical protein